MFLNVQLQGIPPSTAHNITRRCRESGESLQVKSKAGNQDRRTVTFDPSGSTVLKRVVIGECLSVLTQLKRLKRLKRKNMGHHG